jgi:hypothetical protein
MGFSRKINFYFALFILAILIAGCSFVLQPAALVEHSQSQNIMEQNNILDYGQKLVNPPEIIKAVYATAYSSSSKKYLSYLSLLFETTEINAVVVDVKDSSGYVSYASKAPEVKKYNLNSNIISDIDSLIKFFHSQNIYVIGRIVVFEDPVYSAKRPELAIYNKKDNKILWRDYSGLSWLDPASKEVWDYNVSLAKDMFLHGFDEVNFDYVRFPSDGRIENMGFPVWDGKTAKRQIIKDFFAYLRQELPNEKISVDLFGQTTVDFGDMGIGQTIEDAFEYVDYICPMVYPSHYAKGFIGFKNPANYPYEVVKYSMQKAVSRKNIYLENLQKQAEKNLEIKNTPAYEVVKNSEIVKEPKLLTKFRPWLQDFDMGAYYTADMVKQEITATQESLGEDFNGFMLWNPSNIYTQSAISSK